MYTHIVGIAVLALGVSAHPQATTTDGPSRPTGAPGFWFSETYATPSGTNKAFVGGGAAYATGGNAGGYVQGIAAGGPDGPNSASGVASGAFGDANGVASGHASPTGAGGKLAGNQGNNGAFAEGNIGPNGGSACFGGQGAGQGFTTCLSARAAEPEPTNGICFGGEFNGKGFSTCLEARDAMPQSAGGSLCFGGKIGGQSFSTCLQAPALPTA